MRMRLAVFFSLSRIVLCVSTCFIVVGCAPFELTPAPIQATSAPLATPEPAAPLPAPTLDIDEQGLDIAERRLVDLYRRVAPAVVTVTTHAQRSGFFAEMVPREGFGSGFVIDEDGHILTNYHVIEGAQQIEVEFEEGVSFPALVVGHDRRFDLALLKIDAPSDLLQPVEFGISADLQVGQRANTIGNPFGLYSRSLTTGVISGLERTLEAGGDRFVGGIIQLDAAVNQGNSGGPVLDSSGRVIGIITALFSRNGANTGVSFALPVDTIVRALPELMTLGRYRHPYLGVRFGYQITSQMAAALDLPVEEGLLLVQLERGSPLDRVGVRGAQQRIVLWNRQVYIGGDILTAIDGHPVRSQKALQLRLEALQVGDEVTVYLLRGNTSYEARVVLAEDPE